MRPTFVVHDGLPDYSERYPGTVCSISFGTVQIQPLFQDRSVGPGEIHETGAQQWPWSFRRAGQEQQQHGRHENCEQTLNYKQISFQYLNDGENTCVRRAIATH